MSGKPDITITVTGDCSYRSNALATDLVEALKAMGFGRATAVVRHHRPQRKGLSSDEWAQVVVE